MLLQELIKVESTHEKFGARHDIISFVADYFSDLDVVVRKYEFNGHPSIVIANTDVYEFDIIFSGHLDVVGAPPELFSPRVEGDWVYGRGAMDMKSGVAAMMQVFRAHHRRDVSIALLLTTDEEIGGFSGTKELLDTEGYRAAVAVIPDGGYRHNQIALKEKGIIRLAVSVEGVAAHASRPWLGDNAIFKLQSLTADIEQYHQHLQSEAYGSDWYTTINLSRLSGGEAMNTVPEEAVAEYDIRFVEHQTPEEIVGRIEDIAAKHNATVDVYTVGPNVFVDEKNVYVKQYIAALSKTGIEPVFTQDFGASDARFFQLHGIPTIISQPYGLDWHGLDERVSIESVHIYEHTLNQFVQEFERDT